MEAMNEIYKTQIFEEIGCPGTKVFRKVSEFSITLQTSFSRNILVYIHCGAKRYGAHQNKKICLGAKLGIFRAPVPEFSASLQTWYGAHENKKTVFRTVLIFVWKAGLEPTLG